MLKPILSQQYKIFIQGFKDYIFKKRKKKKKLYYIEKCISQKPSL